MQSHFTAFWLSWLRSRCLTNPCQSDIWWLTTAGRNSYQPVLVRIYRNCAILEAWLPSRRGFLRGVASFHDVLNMYPQNIIVRLKFSVQDVCKLWSHCSHCKHDLHDCHEYSTPFSPEMTMIIIDHKTNIYIEWHNKYYQWKQKEAPKLAVEGNRFWSGPSSPPLILLPFLTWRKRSPILVPGLSWPTITTQIQDPISMHTDHNFCAARCFSEN